MQNSLYDQVYTLPLSMGSMGDSGSTICEDSPLLSKLDVLIPNLLDIYVCVAVDTHTISIRGCLYTMLCVHIQAPKNKRADF